MVEWIPSLSTPTLAGLLLVTAGRRMPATGATSATVVSDTSIQRSRSGNAERVEGRASIDGGRERFHYGKIPRCLRGAVCIIRGIDLPRPLATHLGKGLLMDLRWRIELLGRLRAVPESDRDGFRSLGMVTEFRTRKTAVLLAYLAYHFDRAHPREELIEVLWPESDLKRGRACLSNELSWLRQRLEPPGLPAGSVIRADHAAVQLNPEVVVTDVAAYGASLRAAERATSPAEQECFLTRAVELYGGELLPGYYEAWILQEREWLAQGYFRALGRLIELLEQEGDPRQALEFAWRGVRADRLREEAHRELIRLLAATGQLQAAQRQYKELERLLREELDSTPEPQTRKLGLKIDKQLREAARCGEFPSGGAILEPDVREGGAFPLSAPPPPAAKMPAGTVTFLLTDIEGSTALWEQAGAAFKTVRATHRALLRREFQRHGGYEYKEVGDGFLVSFQSVVDALACAVAGQRALAVQTWSAGAPGDAWSGPVRVRMALHTGEVVLEQDEYVTPVLHHASRILAAAHGGQILCSESTARLLRQDALGGLESGVQLLDLGVYRLRDLPTPERLFQVNYPEMVDRTFPPPQAGRGYAGHLPQLFDTFFGRQREQAELEALLLAPKPRLVTLTGAGGTGKTRLALEVARRLVERFHGAVWFVPLADLDDPRRLPDRLRERLGLPHSPTVGPMEQVVAALSHPAGAQAGNGASLLVLDNFEHLVSGGALLVRALLERVPSLTCLVTSRRLLNLAGEREFQLSPLPVPDARPTAPERLTECESVQLFVDRACARHPDFKLTADNARAVSLLCRWLEGIPLALELVAARAHVLTPAQMLDRLQKRRDVAKSSQPDRPGRHASMQAAFDESYRLLTEELQRFFARLSVFRGGWSLEAAEAICDEPLALDYLAQLRESSLVLAEAAAAGEPVGSEEIRFRMLELLREYAWEQLRPEERVVMQERHAAYYLALAEEAEPGLTGAGQIEWVERLEREHDNLRTALEWHLTRETGETGLRMAGALWKFWFGHGHVREGLGWLEKLLARTRDATAARLKCLLGAGTLAFYQADYVAAAAFCGEGLEMAHKLGDHSGAAQALVVLGWVEQDHGNNDRAKALFAESLTAARKAGDRFGAGLALHGLGWVAHRQGDHEQARSLLEESLALFRQLGDTWGSQFALQALGRLALHAKDPQRVAQVYGEVLKLSRKLGHTTGVALALGALGRMAARRGEYEEAVRLLKESLLLQQMLGGRHGIVECLEGLAEVAGGCGEGERMARLLGAAARLRESLAIPLREQEGIEYEHTAAAARARLGEEAFAAAQAEGQAMALEQAVAYALENGGGFKRIGHSE